MKIKKVFFALFSVMILSASLSAAETKLSMELWGRYTADVSGMDINSSEISLARGYFSIEPAISDKIKGRFTLDFSSSDKYEYGVGIRMKYAYLDIKMPVPELSLQAGLIKTYFGAIYDWSYVSVQRPVDDIEKLVSSTDYGISFAGLIPAGFGEYQVAVYNGEGYSKTGTDIDANPAFAANIRIIPVTGVTIGGSVFYEDHSLVADPDSTVSDSLKICYAGMGRVVLGPVDIMGEYLMKKVDSSVAAGYMIMPVLKMNKILPAADIELLARYDWFDKNNDAAVVNDSYSAITGGLNWNIFRSPDSGKPAVFLQANWERTMYEDTSKADADKVYIQLRWLFSSTIK